MEVSHKALWLGCACRMMPSRQAVQKLQSLSIFAFSVKVSCIGLEVNEMASLRAVLQGSRRVAGCRYEQVASLAKASLKLAEDEEPTLEHIRTYLEDLTAESLEDLKNVTPPIFKVATMQPGSVLYFPAGWVMIDRTTSISQCVGLRIPLAVKDPRVIHDTAVVARTMADTESLLPTILKATEVALGDCVALAAPVDHQPGDPDDKAFMLGSSEISPPQRVFSPSDIPPRQKRGHVGRRGHA